MDNKRDYTYSLQQIRGLISGEKNFIANLANISAVLKENLGFFWVGFYLPVGEELVLGPFQGPVACTRIAKGKGVCGTSWLEERSVLVPDVHEFPGHIACSEKSQSEIVVPVFGNGSIIAILDIDSDVLNDFSDSDVKAMEELAQLIQENYGK